jgi:hypothetical protein
MFLAASSAVRRTLARALLILLCSAGEVAAQAAPAAVPDAKPLLRAYGMLKPTVVVANGVESFGSPDFVATSAAANPVFVRDPDAFATSIQAQQTRLGAVVGEGSPVKAQVEVDFVDVSKSSPAQGTGLRLRQAFVEWTMAAGHKLTLGQLWDLFSPLNSHTFDVVGGLFQSGNSGFMRHQLIYTGTFGSIEAALALGLTSQNLQAALGNVEYGRVPTIAPRVSYRLDKRAWVGVSAMFTRISFDAELPTASTSIAAGGNLFADLTLGSLQVRAEAYTGQNLANLGMLVLGQGQRTRDVSEAGGFVSAKLALHAQHAVHASAGAAYVLNPAHLALGYTPAVAASVTTPAVGAVRVAGNGPGITQNATLRAGYAYSPLTGLSLVCEPFVMRTKHKLAAADAANFDAARWGYGVLAGGLYSF